MPGKDILTVYEKLIAVKNNSGAGFMVLLDPDKTPVKKAVENAARFQDSGVDAILIGTSLMLGNGFGEYVEAVKKAVNLPVIIFPGEKSQVTGKADAILFLSLLSGRNPEYLIGEQIRSAPLIKSLKLEAISTAYLLIESGKTTSVEFMSDTKPIPSDKAEIALVHAIAAELFGMKLVYLEAGSGAVRPVPDQMVKTVSSGVSIPIIVGGGIKTPEDVSAKIKSGASFIVVGNHFENARNLKIIDEMARAAHGG